MPGKKEDKEEALCTNGLSGNLVPRQKLFTPPRHLYPVTDGVSLNVL